jgi:hypothetical protein
VRSKTPAAKRKRRVLFARIKNNVTKPQAKKKPAVAPGARARKPKAVATRPAGGKSPAFAGHPVAGKSPALVLPATGSSSLPEFAVIERRPTFVPQRHYWTGGTVVPRITHLKIPPGFVLSSDPSPGPDFRVAHVKVLRTAPEGETVKLVRWVCRANVQAELARRAAAVLAEIREDERRDEANKLAVQRLFARVCGRERTNR